MLAACFVTSCSEVSAKPDQNIQGQYNIYATVDCTDTYENDRVTLWNLGSIGDIIVSGLKSVRVSTQATRSLI